MGFSNTMKKVGNRFAKAAFLPLLVCTAATAQPQGKYGYQPGKNEVKQKQDTAQKARVVNETFLLTKLTLNYHTNGVGYVTMHAEGASGPKNTGTGVARTDLTIDLTGTPGAPEKVNGTNNAIVFTKIRYLDQGNAQNSNNRSAEVEFEIKPIAMVRGSILPTNSSAFTNQPFFAPISEDVDLDSVDINTQGPYGIKVLKFKGTVQELIINTDLPNFSPQQTANSLKGLTSNGLMITDFSAFRYAYPTKETDRNTGGPETMMPTPKNIFKLK